MLFTLKRPTRLINDLPTSVLNLSKTNLMSFSNMSASDRSGNRVTGGVHKTQTLFAPMNKVITFHSSFTCLYSFVFNKWINRSISWFKSWVLAPVILSKLIIKHEKDDLNIYCVIKFFSLWKWQSNSFRWTLYIRINW